MSVALDLRNQRRPIPTPRQRRCFYPISRASSPGSALTHRQIAVRLNLNHHLHLGDQRPTWLGRRTASRGPRPGRSVCCHPRRVSAPLPALHCAGDTFSRRAFPPLESGGHLVPAPSPPLSSSYSHLPVCLSSPSSSKQELSSTISS